VPERCFIRALLPKRSVNCIITLYSTRLTDLDLPESDCSPTVKSFPICADPSWVLYIGKLSAKFCCEANEQGIYPKAGVGGAGLCVAADMSVAPSQTAFEVSSSYLFVTLTTSSNIGFDSISLQGAVQNQLHQAAPLLRRVLPRTQQRRLV
jgi:hypothetical protein